MLALASTRRTAASGLQQASRLLSTGSRTLLEENSGDRGGPHKGRKPSSQYAPWARQVYGRGPDNLQGDNVQPQAPQRWGESREALQERQMRQRRHRRRDDVPRAQEPPAGGFRGNYADSSTSLEDSSAYVRVAPRPQQRQQRMYPAYIHNVSPALLRSDVAAFFDGYNLPVDEIRPQYSWKHFQVQRFWLNFGSAADRERAMSRHMAYLGTRRALVRRATPGEFSEGIYNPLAMSSRGRYVLVEKLGRTCTSEDVIRFFQGFDLHAKSVTFLRETGTSSPAMRGREASEKAVVRFTSNEEAHRAIRERQGGFVGNNAVRMRLLA